MIEWLEIRNFRCLQHVRLDGLGRVNLIVGKNNVGKTTVLEAVQFYLSTGSPNVAWKFLAEREEAVDEAGDPGGMRDPEQSPLLSLFYGRSDLRGLTSEISIRTNDGEVLATIQQASRGDRPLGLSSYVDRGEDLTPTLDVVSDGQRARMIPLNRRFRGAGFDSAGARARFRFVGANGIASERLTTLWDEVVLTEAEDQLVRSLQFLIPGIEKVSFVGSEQRSGRVPKAKLTQFPGPVPLRSLGDGVNRALGLLLSIAAMKDSGVLLVDEIENGIHYSAQDELWRLLIDAAIRFNVQVFATTHSSDCIRAFQRATAAIPGPTGVLTKLERRNGKIVATQFDEDELRIAEDAQIEVR